MKIAKLNDWVCNQEELTALTRRDLEAVQLKKLNRLLLREKQRGGFYGQLPEQLEDLEQLTELPFTTEEDLRSQGKRMVLISQSGIERIRTENTSGTTGASKRLFYSEKDNERTVSFFAAGLSELVNPGERVMICMPFSGGRGLGELIAEAIRQLEAVPVEAGTGLCFAELDMLLERERPAVYVGPPVLLLSLLRLHPHSGLKRALVSADACPAGLLGEIEKLLGSRLYPHYGSREMGLGGAVTCPAFEGMHLRENDVIPEIVDARGRRLKDGEWGELVITTVQAEAMPLIRYRTGDMTRILPEPCPCGSPLCRLDRVRRADNAMAELDELLFQVPEIVDYCVIQKKNSWLVKGYALREPVGCPEQWRGLPVRCEWRSCREGERPCYMAKRRILEDGYE